MPRVSPFVRQASRLGARLEAHFEQQPFGELPVQALRLQHPPARAQGAHDQRQRLFVERIVFEETPPDRQPALDIGAGLLRQFEMRALNSSAKRLREVSTQRLNGSLEPTSRPSTKGPP